MHFRAEHATTPVDYQPAHLAPGVDVPDLRLIIGEAQPDPDSRVTFEDYFGKRIAAGMVEKPEGAELLLIQEDVRGWIAENFDDYDKPGTVDDYRTYDRAAIEAKIGGLVEYLASKHSNVSDLELDATDAFIASAFGMYEDKDAADLPDKDGSFAFIVPARMSRNYPEYGGEVEPVIPALRYVPNELRAWIMRGVPPFIIDTYQADSSGNRGYLLYAPVTEDMRYDLGKVSQSDLIHTAQANVNDAVDFARDRLGVRVVGLGATLPAYTNHGSSIVREDVITTTGHGGTVELICRTIDNMTDKRPESVAVIGLGAIGASAAIIATQKYDGQVSIYDKNQARTKKLVDQYPDRFIAAESQADLIRNNQVIISAVTTPVDLEKLGVEDMSGKLVADDSQPAMFSPGQVAERNGTLVWIIGSNHTGWLRRTGYDYGTMLNGHTDLFGCEAEAASLARYWAELESRGVDPERARKVIGRLALRGPVTATKAAMIGKLFDRFHIGVAEPQAFGEPVRAAA